MTENKKYTWKAFLNRYFIKGLNGMALGLFCSLIVGLIIKQIGGAIGGDFGTLIVQIGTIASVATGAAIGVGTAYVMESPRLIIFASAITGLFGANASALVKGTLLTETGAVALGGAGDPLGAFIAVIAGIEIGRYYPYSYRDHNCRLSCRQTRRTSHFGRYGSSGRVHRICNSSSALRNGNSSFRCNRHDPYTSHKLGGSLYNTWTFGNSLGSGNCRLLLSDGRFCRCKLP